MRIEICGGIGGAVASYQNKLDRLYDRIDDTIEALQNVNRKISDVNGNLNNNLYSAQADINSRIRAEKTKRESVSQLQRESAEFFDNTVSTDKRVAEAIMQNERNFYEKHPHLAPKGIEKGAVWNWILEKWEGFCNTAENIWNGIVEFVKEHAVQLIVGAVALAITAVITFLSCGTLAPMIPVVIGILKGMLGSALFSATISIFTDGDIWGGFLDGVADGFMFGSIGVLVFRIVNVVKNAIKAGSVGRLIPGTEGVVTGGDSTKLGKNMMESMGLPRGTNWKGHQAQHIIPAEMAEHPILKRIGMDLDDASNGLFLRTPADDISAMSRHRGYHSTYNEFVKKQLDAMDINQSVKVLQNQVYNLQQNLKYLQQSGLPLYPSQGATVNLWQRSLERIQ